MFVFIRFQGGCWMHPYVLATSHRFCPLRLITYQEMVAEMRASAAYDTTILSENVDVTVCKAYLEGLVSGKRVKEGYCVDVPAEAFEGRDAPDITMYGTTSLTSFTELVRDVPINAVVQVQYKYPRTTGGGKVSHIVVVGPDGFQLCTCLKLMRCGLHCNHMLAALVTRLGRAKDFVGESIHPRWRSSVAEWSLGKASLATFDGHETFTGGYTEDFNGADADADGDGDNTLTTNVEFTRRKMYADYIAATMQWAGQASAMITGTPASRQAFLAFQEAQRVAFAAFMGSKPSDELLGLGNPPITLPKDKKETRHKDARGTTGPPKKKVKVES